MRGKGIPQRALWFVLTVSLLAILAACGRDAPRAVTSNMQIDELPEGLGRGYPLGAIAGGNENTSIAVGKRAPNFSLSLEDGRVVTLHDLKGQPVMINFWATWCGPCRIEMPEIIEAAHETPELVVLAVNVQEDLSLIESFAQDFEMDVPIVRDEGGDIQNLYQVRGMPTTYFVDRQGTVRAVWAGVLTPDRLDTLLNEIL